NNLQAIYNLIDSLVLGENVKKWRYLIWHYTCWCMWKHRNDIIFKGHTFDGGELLGGIKINSWEWFLYKKQNTARIFFS
ncbi:hypothetical protein glysoja_031777, partial [Glycine soja]